MTTKTTFGEEVKEYNSTQWWFTELEKIMCLSVGEGITADMKRAANIARNLMLAIESYQETEDTQITEFPDRRIKKQYVLDYWTDSKLSDEETSTTLFTCITNKLKEVGEHLEGVFYNQQYQMEESKPPKWSFPSWDQSIERIKRTGEPK